MVRLRVGICGASAADVNQVCIAIYPVTARIDLEIPPRYLGAKATVIVFRRARGADSVRVVLHSAFAAHAP